MHAKKSRKKRREWDSNPGIMLATRIMNFRGIYVPNPYPNTKDIKPGQYFSCSPKVECSGN